MSLIADPRLHRKVERKSKQFKEIGPMFDVKERFLAPRRSRFAGVLGRRISAGDENRIYQKINEIIETSAGGIRKKSRKYPGFVRIPK